MKKIFISILFSTLSLFSVGQITGGFFYGSDYNGNVFIYFKGTNISEYTYQIKIRSVNELLVEEESWDCNLSSGESFTVGPSDGWYWQPGEKLIITYSNGESYYWIYAPQQNNNFNYNFNNYNYNNQFNSNTPATTEQYKTCYTCYGTGSCNVCHGSGRYSLFGNSSECSACGGDGKCWHCHGTRKQ